MLDALKIDTSSFSSSYPTLKKKHTFDRMRLRQELATANNCIAIGDNSCYADMVAVPRDYDNIVIKICSGQDAFIDYAHFCARGVLTGESHLKIYSETEIAPGVWLFVMERLATKMTPQEWDKKVSRGLDRWSSIPQRGRYARANRLVREGWKALEQAFNDAGKDFCRDLHRGNIMCRADGTPVLLDPVC